jgi:hypothetical protein
MKAKALPYPLIKKKMPIRGKPCKNRYNLGQCPPKQQQNMAAPTHADNTSEATKDANLTHTNNGKPIHQTSQTQTIAEEKKPCL